MISLVNGQPVWCLRCCLHCSEAPGDFAKTSFDEVSAVHMRGSDVLYSCQVHENSVVSLPGLSNAWRTCRRAHIASSNHRLASGCQTRQYFTQQPLVEIHEGVCDSPNIGHYSM